MTDPFDGPGIVPPRDSGGPGQNSVLLTGGTVTCLGGKHRGPSASAKVARSSSKLLSRHQRLVEASRAGAADIFTTRLPSLPFKIKGHSLSVSDGAFIAWDRAATASSTVLASFATLCFLTMVTGIMFTCFLLPDGPQSLTPADSRKFKTNHSY